jgi:hypothetical protein
VHSFCIQPQLNRFCMQHQVKRCANRSSMNSFCMQHQVIRCASIRQAGMLSVWKADARGSLTPVMPPYKKASPVTRAVFAVLPQATTRPEGVQKVKHLDYAIFTSITRIS